MKKRDGRVRESSPEYAPTGVVLYKAPDGLVSVEVKVQQDTVWLSLNQMVDLFGRDKSVISRHLRNIFYTKELERDSTVAFFATVQHEGDRRVERQVEFYNRRNL